MTRVTAGFIPLTDAAPLIAAKECGFAAAVGIDLHLVREVSWANIRDKLSVGLFDAAHMLAPMALASALGVGHVRVPLSVPLALGLNGAAITISAALAGEMGGVPDDPGAALAPLADALKRRRMTGGPLPAFGIVFPFSTHNYLLRAYLAAGGIDPDRDVQLVVIPPALMVGSLERGLIDGFCVGSPWNSVAVDRGIGHILAAGASLFAALPEKVLAVGDGFAGARGSAAAALVAAVNRAAVWCADPAHAGDLARLLAAPDYLDVPEGLVRRTIDGSLVFSRGAPPRHIDDFLRFDGPEATTPRAGRFRWLYAQMVRWGQTRFDYETLQRVDGWLAAGRIIGSEPAGDPVASRIEPAFDPQAVAAYLERFDGHGMRKPLP
jgi:two-component system, oxyanion-binding sensor